MFGKKRKIKKDEALNRLKNDEIRRLRIDQYIVEFHNQLSILQEKGLKNEGDWRAMLSEYNITPLTEEEQKTIKESGIPLSRSAYPIEFNKVLTHFIQIESKKTEDLILELNDCSSISILKHFKEALGTVQSDSLLTYIEKAKPKMNVSAIFNNAASSLNQYSKYTSTDKVESIKCKTCGAARLEVDQYENCFYCGATLFE